MEMEMYMPWVKIEKPDIINKLNKPSTIKLSTKGVYLYESLEVVCIEKIFCCLPMKTQ